MLAVLSKYFIVFMNSFDLSSIGPTSSQIMTSELINAFFNGSAANLHPVRLTKYFPTLGPFSVSVTETKTSLSFVARSMNSPR